MGNFTEAEKTQYTYWLLEYMGLTCSNEIFAAKPWAELIIKGQKVFGNVPSTKQLNTAMRLIELGHGDLVPEDYKTANGLA